MASIKIPLPKEPKQMVTAIVAYAGVAKRLHLELSHLAETTDIDLDAIKADLINEAKKAVPAGDFTKDEVGLYNTMFEAIETIFKPLNPAPQG
ncbi:hypothetical protein [Labrenzia sp. CE80]|uniref:hypothetical protein n=1 Tax=Labrenzia sp. CE80 TaxID=1788986 RepID=UPI00129A66F8|nr:hypothetical protein [Labrenzia sp. CE80]